MTPEVERLFHEVADLTESGRAAYFSKRSIDPAVRAEVMSLLAHDARSTGDIATTILDSVESLHTPTGALERCGAYVLTTWIGRGGMGSVFCAERVDGEVTQQAAIKLLRDSHDDPIARSRFMQERQILANLSHPNIARLLDAGHTASGRPYLAMELVRGKTIDAYCEGLGVTSKIRLMLKLCDAVSYAHRNLVIHRDIKPGNILVDENGEPKLLDFGIARIVSVDPSLTSTIERAFTPEYASPEQAGAGPVTTAADIFSLAAVLYKLLTGKAPHQFESRTPEAVQAAILRAEILRPTRHNPTIDGDLDAILMRALRKEQDLRYATVEEFAADLRAYLDNRPVSARRGEWLYEVRKFAVRHWIPVAALTVAFAGLAGGLLFALRERNIAQRRFAQVRELSNRLFDVEQQVRTLPGSLAARQYIVDVGLSYLKSIESEAGGDTALMLEVANAYRRLANIQARRGAVSLGKPQEALEALRAGKKLSDQVLAKNPDHLDGLRASIALDSAMAGLALEKEDQVQSDALARLEQTTARLATRVESPADRDLLHSAYSVIHYQSLNLHFPDRARVFGEKLIANAREMARSETSEDASYRVAAALRMFATFLRYEGELERAVPMFDEALESMKVVKSEIPLLMERGNIEYYKGLVLGEPGHLSLGRTAEALAALESCIQTRRKLMAKDPNDHNAKIDFVQAMAKQGLILASSDPKRALALLDEAYAVMSKAPVGSAYRNTYLIRLDATAYYPLRAMNRPGEARARLQRAKEAASRTSEQDFKYGPMSHRELLNTAYAEEELASGFPNRALVAYREILSQFRAHFQRSKIDDIADSYAMSLKLARVTEILRQTGNSSEADELEQERIAIWRKWMKSRPTNPFVLKQWNALRAAGLVGAQVQ